jgi:hypothetical protein
MAALARSLRTVCVPSGSRTLAAARFSTTRSVLEKAHAGAPLTQTNREYIDSAGTDTQAPRSHSAGSGRRSA